LSADKGDGFFAWTTSNEAVRFAGDANKSKATIEANPLPLGKTSKKAKLTCIAAGGKKAVLEITVSSKAKKAENMRLAKTATWLNYGKSETLKAKRNEGKGANGKKLAAPGNKNLVWSIEEYYWDGSPVDSADKGAVAVVSAKGKVTAKGYGYAVVTATTAEEAPTPATSQCVVYCMKKK
jgi:UDP:flavonoid glycosyltransferase YjiC (YdhE family)